MTQRFCAMSRTYFPIWPTAAMLDFKIQLVSLDISFFDCSVELLCQRGHLHHDLK